MFYLNKLFKNLKSFKNKTALISDDDKKITYSNLIKNIENFLVNLENKKKLVFLIGQNNFETVVGYLSFVKKGYVVVLLDYKINNFFFNKLLLVYKPDYIFREKKKINISKLYFKKLEYDSYVLYKRKFNQQKKINKNLMLMMSTSGSTGSQKFVKLSYRNLDANTKSIIKCLKIKKIDITITTLPISYVYGLSILNTHLMMGSTIVMTNKSMFENTFWNLIDKYKVNNFGAVPFQYNIIEKIFKRKVPSSIKYTTQAGGKMNQILIQNIINIYKKNKIQFIQMYGAAEATARMSYLKWSQAGRKVGSIGKAIPNGKFYIIDENKKKINKIYKRGELIFKGPNVSMGYSENLNDLSLQDVNKGILKTGDIAFKDDDGFYYISGRKNRYAKVYGARVDLSELENLLFKKGIDVIMKNAGENKIFSYFKNAKELKEGIKYICKLTLINRGVFVGRVISKKNLTPNYKYKV